MSFIKPKNISVVLNDLRLIIFSLLLVATSLSCAATRQQMPRIRLEQLRSQSFCRSILRSFNVYPPCPFRIHYWAKTVWGRSKFQWKVENNISSSDFSLLCLIGLTHKLNEQNLAGSQAKVTRLEINVLSERACHMLLPYNTFLPYIFFWDHDTLSDFPTRPRWQIDWIAACKTKFLVCKLAFVDGRRPR